MYLSLMMLLQAGVAGPPDVTTSANIGPGFDLHKLSAVPDCPKPVAGEIVVCASVDAQSTFRLRPLPPDPGDAPLKAETQIGKAKLSAEAESATLSGGTISNRAMVRVKIPF